MADSIAEVATMAEDPAFVELFPGTELSAEDADVITLQWPAKLVVFAGAEASGKTTVIASIYERLSQGSLTGFRFAGSRSLLGFEQICHLNRLASGAPRSDTPRTVPTDRAAYYHIAVRGEGERSRRHILLSAVSGELYWLARNSREDCRRLTYLHRADVVVILIDGARIAVPEQRSNAQADASGILESFLDANMLSPSCRVGFVFSKLDRILAAGQSATAFMKTTQDKFESRFGDRVQDLTFKQIAARPDASAAGLNDGLDDAFGSWIAPTSPGDLATWRPTAPPDDAREFGKFGWRYFEKARRDKP